MTQVESLEHLKQLCLDNKSEYFIKLGFGRSSKHIEYSESDDKWYIYNEMDDTEQVLSSKKLFDKDLTNIGYAINTKKFYCYD